MTMKKTKTQFQLELKITQEQLETLQKDNKKALEDGVRLTQEIKALKVEKQVLANQLREAVKINTDLQKSIDNHWRPIHKHVQEQVNVLEKRVIELNKELDNSWKSYHKEVVRLDKLIDTVFCLSVDRNQHGREKV